MGPGAVTLALEVLGGIDATLRAHGVGALDGHDRKKVNIAACFGDLNHGGKACEATAYYDNSG